MDALQYGRDIWKIIIDLCDLESVISLGRTCKTLRTWSMATPRGHAILASNPYHLKEIDLKEQVSRIAIVSNRVLVLTESFVLKDVSTHKDLMTKVRDFVCDEKMLAVCRQPKTMFRFERYVWTDLGRPIETSNYFWSVAEMLCFDSKTGQLAACVNQTQVVKWEFELKEVEQLQECEVAVTSLRFGSDGELLVQDRASKTPNESCKLGQLTVVATDNALTVGEQMAMQLPHMDHIEGVKPLFDGRAFVTLHDCGKVFLWFSAEQKREVCESHPHFKLIACQLAVGENKIAYLMEGKKVRILQRESSPPQ